jgi:hypothetical protein
MTQFNHTPEQARKLWCEALRSGKYKQGAGFLCYKTSERGEFFCCLGVACEVFMEHEPGLIDKNTFMHLTEYGKDWSYSTVVLPKLVAEWLGVPNDKIMSIPQGLLPDVRSQNTLTSINDYGNADFNKIADIIEFNYPQGS